MLLLTPSVSGLFKWRQFEPEVILLAVGWYLRFVLSYRDMEELIAERGFLVDHVTVWRWVQRYVPELERRSRSRLKPTSDSWRVDSELHPVMGKWGYLYRAVNSSGATIDFLHSAKQDAAAAKRFLSKTLGRQHHPVPRVINTDGHSAYWSAVCAKVGLLYRFIVGMLEWKSDSLELSHPSPLRFQSCNTTAVTSSHMKYDRLLRLPSGHSIRFALYTRLLLHD